MPDRATSLLTLISDQAARRPHTCALVWRGGETSYQQLLRQIECFADQCYHRFEPGDRIGVLAWNCPEYVAMLYAVPNAGQILVPLNTRLAAAELAAQISDAGVRALFGHSDLLETLPTGNNLATISFEHDLGDWLRAPAQHRSVSISIDQPAWMLFTSGTTGRPKGALLTQRSLLAGLRSAQHGRPVRTTDRYLYPFPLFHIAAHNVLLNHQHGATVILLPSFNAGEVLRACQQHSITTLSLAPTMIKMLLEQPGFSPQALAGLRSIGYGASGISLPLLRDLLDNTEAALSQGYGMTELSGTITFLDAQSHRQATTTSPQLLQSAGKPVPGVEIKLIGEGHAPGSGEILVRAEQTMQGYWQQPETTAQTLVNGWLHTGDIGRFDESGYLYIVDRKKDMIVTGGENVASREIEAILEQHAGVSQAAVVGIPDSHWGETICALIRPTGDQQPEVSELNSYCRQHLAGYKTPRLWQLSVSLPVNAAGKIDKKTIRALFTHARDSMNID